MDDALKSNLTSSKHWLRLVFMLLFAGILQIATLLMWALVTLQFLFSLVTGKDNDQLRHFGGSLSAFIYQSLRFLTYNSEEKPFPFADWPAPEKGDAGENTVTDRAERSISSADSTSADSTSTDSTSTDDASSSNPSSSGGSSCGDSSSGSTTQPG